MKIVKFLFYSGILGRYGPKRYKFQPSKMLKLNRLIHIQPLQEYPGIMKILYLLF